MLLDKPSPPHTTVVQFISYQLKFAIIMFKLNKICFIFIVFMVMCCLSQSFRLQTEESLTAVRGGIISVPCKFSVPAHAVYWYKHNFTGAPDDGASLVARDFIGFTDPLHGFERFSITKDYSLIVGNVTVHDETTYSCLVVEIDSERGYTDLRVVALAEPLEPIVKSCNVTAQGRCTYTVDENSPEDVTLVCMVHNVRPPPDLTWIRSDGRIPENATHQTQEKDGLFNVSSQIQVSMSYFDHHYTCQAKGEAVNGTSSTIITIQDNVTVSHDHWIYGGLITGIVFGAFLLLIIMSVSCLIYKKCGYPKSSKERTACKLPKSEQLNIIESILPMEQEEFTARKLPKPEQLKIIESKLSIEQEEALTKTELDQKIEAYENEKRKNRAAFEKERLNTQEALTKTELDQKIEAYENEKRKNRAALETERLNTQEALTKTELDQKIEEYENEKRKNRAAFEKERLNTQGNELRMITLIILYLASGYIKQSNLKVNQHMQLEELKCKLCAKFRIDQSLIHFAHDGQNLSRGGPEDLKTVGLDDFSVLNVSKIF